jgi:hypothetical protein
MKYLYVRRLLKAEIFNYADKREQLMAKLSRMLAASATHSLCDGKSTMGKLNDITSR